MLKGACSTSMNLSFAGPNPCFQPLQGRRQVARRLQPLLDQEDNEPAGATCQHLLRPAVLAESHCCFQFVIRRTLWRAGVALTEFSVLCLRSWVPTVDGTTTTTHRLDVPRRDVVTANVYCSGEASSPSSRRTESRQILVLVPSSLRNGSARSSRDCCRQFRPRN